jgi:hypothetical protein
MTAASATARFFGLVQRVFGLLKIFLTPTFGERTIKLALFSSVGIKGKMPGEPVGGIRPHGPWSFSNVLV